MERNKQVDLVKFQRSPRINCAECQPLVEEGRGGELSDTRTGRCEEGVTRQLRPSSCPAPPKQTAAAQCLRAERQGQDSANLRHELVVAMGGHRERVARAFL